MFKRLMFLLCAVPAVAFANNAQYNLMDSPLDFNAPVVFDKTNLTQAGAGTIVYDNNAGAFFGLMPGGDPGTATSWIQLGGSSTGSVVTATGGAERIERATMSAACTSDPCSLGSKTNGIDSVEWVSTGQYIIHFTAGTFSSAPVCMFTFVNDLGFPRQTGKTSTAYNVDIIAQPGTGYQNTQLEILCMGPQ